MTTGDIVAISATEALITECSDNLTTCDIGRLLQAHHSAPLLATLGVFHAPHPERCGIVTVESGLVVAFE